MMTTATAITTASTVTITTGTTMKTVPFACISARDIASIGHSPKCESETAEHIGAGVIGIRTTITTAANLKTYERKVAGQMFPGWQGRTL